MVTLDTSYGWTNGDDLRVLIASGLSVSKYSINVIRSSMNEIGEEYDDAVNYIIDLLDEWDTAQAKFIAMNNNNEGKTLVKADVLEWETEKGGVGYSPIMEFRRIRELLRLYFANCPLMVNEDNGVRLIRS